MSTEVNLDRAGDTPVAVTIRRARAIGQTLLGTQVEKQANFLGDSVADISETLAEVALDFKTRQTGTWIAPAFDGAATRIGAVADYLRRGTSERFSADFSRYAGQRPAVVGVAALASGFALARILRVSIAETPGGSPSKATP